MKAKSFLILLLLAGIAALGAWWLAFRPAATPAESSSNGETQTVGVGERLLPALSERADAIARITITDAGEDRPATELTLDGETWRVEDKAGFPASSERVRRLITGLSELRTAEPKTARPELYDRLAVQWPDETERDPDDFSARPTLVRITDAAGDDIAAVVLGDTTYAGGESRQYARALDGDRAWLVSGTVNIPQGALGFIEKRFVELPRESVERVTIHHPNGELLVLSRTEGDGDFVIEDLPDGMMMTGQALANNTGNALGFVNFTDVADAEEVLDRSNLRDEDQSGGTSPGDLFGRVTADFTTFDGLSVRLLIQPENEEGRTAPSWVWVSASGEGAEPINERLGAHAFMLPASTIESLTRRPSELLAELVGDEPEEAGPSIPEGSTDIGLPEPTDG